MWRLSHWATREVSLFYIYCRLYHTFYILITWGLVLQHTTYCTQYKVLEIHWSTDQWILFHSSLLDLILGPYSTLLHLGLQTRLFWELFCSYSMAGLRGKKKAKGEEQKKTAKCEGEVWKLDPSFPYQLQQGPEWGPGLSSAEETGEESVSERMACHYKNLHSLWFLCPQSRLCRSLSCGTVQAGFTWPRSLGALSLPAEAVPASSGRWAPGGGASSWFQPPRARSTRTRPPRQLPGSGCHRAEQLSACAGGSPGLRRRHFSCPDAEREAESRRRYPLPSVAQTLPEPLPLWMIGRIWCTRRSWPSRLSDTTVSWGGNGGLEFSDPLPPPTEAGSGRQNGGIVAEPGPGTWIREAGNSPWAPRAVGGSRPSNLTPRASSPADTRELGGQGHGVEELVVKWRLGGGRVLGRGRGRRWRVLSLGEQSPGELLGRFWDVVNNWVAWRKKKHPPHGGEWRPGAGARAPFREIWRVGAVAFPRRPNVGRRLWSLTKENPYERRASPGLWWGAVLDGGGGRRERVGISAVHPWAEASWDATIGFPSLRPAHLVVAFFRFPVQSRLFLGSSRKTSLTLPLLRLTPQSSKFLLPFSGLHKL